MIAYESPLIIGERQKSGKIKTQFLDDTHATQEERRSILPLLCFCLVVLIDSYRISVVKDKKDKKDKTT